MKRLLSAALALTLLSGSVAYADPYRGPRDGHYDRWDNRGDRHDWGRRDWDRHDRYRHRDNGAGTAIAVGVGLLALTAILASQDNDRRERVYYREDYVPPPPPPPPPPYYYGD